MLICVVPLLFVKRVVAAPQAPVLLRTLPLSPLSVVVETSGLRVP